MRYCIIITWKILARVPAVDTRGKRIIYYYVTLYPLIKRFHRSELSPQLVHPPRYISFEYPLIRVFHSLSTIVTRCYIKP